jgi:hypothetical protein
MEMLQTISAKELAHECLSADEEMFLRRLVEVVDAGSIDYRPRPPQYEGWYFSLFYRPVHFGGSDAQYQQALGGDAADRLVADVHTDVPCPVLSHYEFEVLGPPRRLDDTEWSDILNRAFPMDVPPARIEGLAPPPWTAGFLVPAP